MLRSLCLTAILCNAAGCACLEGKRKAGEPETQTNKRDLNELGKQVDGTSRPNNALAALASNEFNSSHISHRVDMPVQPVRK